MGELKITTTGDKFAATLLYKVARNQMAELKHSMSYLGLQQNKLEKRPYEGVIISCHSFMGIDTVNIHVEPGVVIDKHVSEQYRITEEHFWYAFNASIYDGNKVFGYTGLNDMAIDINGNAYSIGSAPTDSSVSSGEPSIIKYDKNGRFLLRRMVYSSSGFDSGTGIDIDQNTRDMYFSYDQYNDGRIQNYDGGFAKYNAIGEVQWQKIIQPAGGLDVTILTRDVVAIRDEQYPDVLDSNSSAICGRYYSYTDDSYVSFITKFNHDGSVHWTKSFGNYVEDYPGNEIPQIEDLSYFDGHIIASGYQWITGGDEFTYYPSALIMKFSLDGTLVWKKRYQGWSMRESGDSWYYADGIRITDTAIDNEGNIYAITFSHFIPVAGVPVDYCHVTIFKISPEGTTIWHRTAEFPSLSGYDFSNTLPYSVSVAVSNGGVFVAFPSYDSGSSTTDTTVARLSKADGAVVWKRKITIPSTSIDDAWFRGFFPKAIHVLRDDLYIAGNINSDFLQVTMKIPTIGIALGKHGYLHIEQSDINFYSRLEDVPYRMPPSEFPDGYTTPYYYMTEFTDPLVTIGTVALSISTLSTGDRGTEDWNRTEKILRKFTKEKIN